MAKERNKKNMQALWLYGARCKRPWTNFEGKWLHTMSSHQPPGNQWHSTNKAPTIRKCCALKPTYQCSALRPTLVRVFILPTWILRDRIHVWYIYLHDWVIFRANVGKYTIHGAYGKGCKLVNWSHLKGTVDPPSKMYPSNEWLTFLHLGVRLLRRWTPWYQMANRS